MLRTHRGCNNATKMGKQTTDFLRITRSFQMPNVGTSKATSMETGFFFSLFLNSPVSLWLYRTCLFEFPISTSYALDEPSKAVLILLYLNL